MLKSQECLLLYVYVHVRIIYSTVNSKKIISSLYQKTEAGLCVKSDIIVEAAQVRSGPVWCVV